MPRSPAPITASELDVLKTLWKLGPAAVRDLEVHFGTGKGWAYTTVQTLLYRLQEKGYVQSDKSQTPHVFRAKVTRRDLMRLRLRDLADTLCEGTATPLLMTLVEDEPLDAQSLRELRELLERLEADQPPANKRRGKP